MDFEWYYQLEDGIHGPVSEDKLRERVANGVISRDTLVSRESWGEWMRAEWFPGLFEEPKVTTARQSVPKGKRQQGGGLKPMGVLFALVFLAMWLMSTTCEKKPGSDWGGENQVIYNGRQELKKTLREPDSLQIITESSGVFQEVVWYRATFRAKNGVGGYVEDEFYTFWDK